VPAETTGGINLAPVQQYQTSASGDRASTLGKTADAAAGAYRATADITNRYRRSRYVV